MAQDPTGWMPSVPQVRTSAWGGYGIPEDAMYPQAVVTHVAQGYYGGLLNIARTNDPNKSWHFSVARDGSITQHVSIWDPAYHAGIVADPQSPAAALMAQYGQNPNTWSVGIEQEGFSIPPGYSYDYLYDAQHPWPAQQLASVIRIHRWVWDSCQWLLDLPSERRESRILTHSMIDQRTRKQDPGDLWLSTMRPLVVQAIAPNSAIPNPEPVRTYEDGLRDGRAAGIKDVINLLNTLA